MAAGQRGLAGMARAVRHSDAVVFVAVVGIVMMMVIPMPPMLLDVLLATNITVSLLVLLLTMNVRDPLQFSVFPSLLLVVTLFRLALNISSTRLILLRGYAGRIIEAFGHFVVGGNYLVGFIIFLILVVIQFIVITRGAERVAEVAARFTLDAMPGKQMSIDADLNAGLITEQEARARRQSIEREADFYGAMDGASKFVKGDAIASVVITLINILGGLGVGVLQRGLEMGEAMQRYTLLTVGDGLVTQIPALLVSTATGLIVTRAASEQNMGQDLTRQLFSQPRTLGAAAGILVALGLVPGLPTLPFLVLAGASAGASYLLAQYQRQAAERERLAAIEREREEAKRPESVMSLLQTDPVELEIGYSLIPLVDQAHGAELLDRITMVRRQVALELGLVVPPIRIRDNVQLKPNVYVIKLRGVEVGRGELMPHHLLAMDAGEGLERLSGVRTREPAFGLPAVWIAQEQREQAELLGCTVVDAPSVLATHLSELLHRHAAELLGRQETRQLLDHVKTTHSAVVEELIPELLTVGEVQKVLQNLLQEGVPIRDLVTILEALADAARESRDPDTLTERVRMALARHISRLYGDDDGVIPVITLSPGLERKLEELAASPAAPLEPDFVSRLVRELGRLQEAAAARGRRAVVLCSPSVRRYLRRLIERSLPRLPVISFAEVTPGAQVAGEGVVELADAS
ncbi:flagellar biosynthesis protein FlhA [Geochorda subterranea]|uniref:Flagellar biosynthesis protein FlhA n=1 Tax=Geochorda subterranea TaxID=3109564 RepID=A0ABZ1BLI7_9FIRM|nr:flagellar biosynthesis protein FlhA [Limnochorda sp. LNt]WRP13321.1 flagellar biosynthesis protein FlhA [Limnochorda sp. LNt]